MAATVEAGGRGDHSPDHGGAWPAIDSDRRCRKIQGKEIQKQSLFPDCRSATLVAGSLNQKYEKKGKEERKKRKAHPRPPVTSPTRNHGEKPTVPAALLRKIGEKEREKRPMIDLKREGRPSYRGS